MERNSLNNSKNQNSVIILFNLYPFMEMAFDSCSMTSLFHLLLPLASSVVDKAISFQLAIHLLKC